MEITHQKGLLYPLLQRSSFRVSRNDCSMEAILGATVGCYNLKNASSSS